MIMWIQRKEHAQQIHEALAHIERWKQRERLSETALHVCVFPKPQPTLSFLSTPFVINYVCKLLKFSASPPSLFRSPPLFRELLNDTCWLGRGGGEGKKVGPSFFCSGSKKRCPGSFSQKRIIISPSFGGEGKIELGAFAIYKTRFILRVTLSKFPRKTLSRG